MDLDLFFNCQGGNGTGTLSKYHKHRFHAVRAKGDVRTRNSNGDHQIGTFRTALAGWFQEQSDRDFWDEHPCLPHFARILQA